MAAESVVVETLNCEVVLDAWGFYARCTARGCTWVTDHVPSKHRARQLATDHDEAS